MIAHISGQIVEKFLNSVIVDVQGVGYEITLTTIDYESAILGSSQKYYTYHSVRENTEELFGFSSLAAKKLFQLLLTVNSVGPKAAINILSLAPAEQIRNVLANADTAFIAKASGVGKKTAERVILELRDKVGNPTTYGTNIASSTEPIAADPALDALIALGFSLKEATIALSQVDPMLPLEERVRLALKQ